MIGADPTCTTTEWRCSSTPAEDAFAPLAR